MMRITFCTSVLFSLPPPPLTVLASCRFYKHQDLECWCLGKEQWPGLCDTANGTGRLHTTGWGVLQTETQRPQTAVAPPDVQWHCESTLLRLHRVPLLSFCQSLLLVCSIKCRLVCAPTDNVFQRCRQVWRGSYHLSNGRAVCMEPATQRQDYLRKSTAGHRAARPRTEENVDGKETVPLQALGGLDWCLPHHVASIHVCCCLFFLFLGQSLIAFPKIKRQVLLCEPEARSLKDFTDNSLFWVNQEFGLM